MIEDPYAPTDPYEATWLERIGALTAGARAIRQDADGTRWQKALWYADLPFGWARHQWETRPRLHLFARGYTLLLRALRVRRYEYGDDLWRLVLTEPWEFPPRYLWDRYRCRRHGIHSTYCAGIPGHVPTRPAR